MGFPANRARLGDDGNVDDIFVGNILAVRCDGEELASILESDVSYIEERLCPVMLLDGGTIVRLPCGGLPEYKQG